MSYRSDLEAAQARADAAERRAAELQKQVDQERRAKEAAEQRARLETERRPKLDGQQRPPTAKDANDTSGTLHVPIPEGFDIERSADGVKVSWSWFRARHHLPLLFFCIAWDGFLVFWYANAASAADSPWLAYVFPAAHVAAGVGLTYALFAGLLNSTIVSAADGVLRVRHTPIPWRGNRELTRGAVRQLYVVENTTESDGTKTTKYDLCAVLDDGRELKLVRGLDDLTQGRYLEQLFERHFSIPDRRVPDEVSKR